MLDVVTFICLETVSSGNNVARHCNGTRWLRMRDLISGRDLLLINVPAAALVVCSAAHTRSILEDGPSKVSWLS